MESFFRAFNDTACDFFETCIIKNLNLLYDNQLSHANRIVTIVFSSIGAALLLAAAYKIAKSCREKCNAPRETGLSIESINFGMSGNPFREALSPSRSNYGSI